MALREQIRTRAQVGRDGQPTSIGVEAVVPGDIILLSAGSIVCGDAILVESADLFVSQAVLISRAGLEKVSLIGYVIPMENEQANDPRVFLAIDRTFLAWTRTSLASMAFGFVVARLGLFFRELARTQGQGTVLDAATDAQSMQSIVIGTVLVVLGVVIQALALFEHRQLTRAFKSGAAVLPLSWSLAQWVGISLIAIGVGVAGYVVSLY